MSTEGLHGRSRGRRAALALLVVTVVAAVISAYLGRGYFVDSWWMWRLGSSDRWKRIEAAEKLAERKCLRAVPKIVRLIEEDPGENTRTVTSMEVSIGATYAYGRVGPDGEGSCRMIPSDPVKKQKDRYRTATPLVLALWCMGEDAVPAIERAEHDLRTRIRGSRRGETGRALLVLSILEDLQDRSTRVEPQRKRGRAP